MAEAAVCPPSPPADGGGAAPRQRARLRRRAGAIAFGIGMILGTIHAPPAPRLLWNASASAPIGLYWVEPGARLRVGDMAIAVPPGPARMLAARRHYVPVNVPLVKRVMATEGALVCAIGPAILIDGRVAARRFAADPHGRALPWWRGCRRLGGGEVLLLNRPVRSFDGRYFGPVGAGAIVGKAVPLWLR